MSVTNWETEARNASETLERAKTMYASGIYPEAVQNAIVSGELQLKAVLRKNRVFRETGNPNDKTHNMQNLWDRVKTQCTLSPSTIRTLDDVFITRGGGKETLQYINRTAPAPYFSHADCAHLPSTRYSTDNATPYDLFSEAYALEKIQLAEQVKNELAPYLS